MPAIFVFVSLLVWQECVIGDRTPLRSEYTKTKHYRIDSNFLYLNGCRKRILKQDGNCYLVNA